MKKSDFNFDLPEELIAQTPIENRSSSRLLVLDKETGEINHDIFSSIPKYMNKGDAVILNNSKVMPARLIGTKAVTGGMAEFLLTEIKKDGKWEALVRPGKRLREGSKVIFGDGILEAEITDILPNHNRLVKFNLSGNDFYNALDKIGEMPLPHYIKEKLSDKDRYQTVYAKEIGSCAAPTAGLHFTNILLEEIAKQGINIDFVTLHVGIGTFRPVKVDSVTDHHMHSEHYFLPKSVADTVNDCKANKKKVFAVGTTSCRTLEAVGTMYDGILKESEGYTDIFIYPGYNFKIVDKLITNFHLPESTLIMLVSALAGREKILDAYNEAIREKYKFFSFGDAMLIK